MILLGVRCHSICWSNRIPVTTCDSSVTAAVSLMPVQGRCHRAGWNFVWRYVVDWKGNLMTVVLSWSKRILLNTLTRKIKISINLVPQIPVFIQYSNIYPSYVPLISFNYLYVSIVYLSNVSPSRLCYLDRYLQVAATFQVTSSGIVFNPGCRMSWGCQAV